MSRPDQFFEWRSLVERDPVLAVGSRERLRLLWAAFVVACLLILGRALQLELTEGAAFRAAAAQPGRQNEVLPAPRGRILARDGSELAADMRVTGLAVHYRYLEEPPDPVWLRRQARLRLPSADRQRPLRVAEATAAVLAERDALAGRLAQCCGIGSDEWRRRAARIQRRVAALARHVNTVRERAAEQRAAEQASRESAEGAAAEAWWRPLAELFAVEESRSTARVTVVEETDFHVVVDALPADTCAALRAQFSGHAAVRLVESSRRTYPAGSLAANIIGYVGPRQGSEASFAKPPAAETRPDPRRSAPGLIGLLGVERGYEGRLRGRPGLRTHLTDHRGQWLATQSTDEAVPGSDVMLTLDPAVQQAAEGLLDQALQAAPASSHESLSASAAPAPTGGAIVVMDVHSGELLAAASAPRFDPNDFTRGDDDAVGALLAAEGHPLFDRASKMALPPGSVFKVITAAALLETAAISPDTPFDCQGYLRSADRLRCAAYRHNGVGHGHVRLTGALAQSCNVFFFHFAGEMGPGPLVTWAERFGAGRATGVDLPNEAAGRLGTPGSLPRLAHRAWKADDTYSLAVGQGPITATPLQVARWLAAIANGGDLVVPRITLAGPASSSGPAAAADRSAERLALSPQTLAALREALEQVVRDPLGTGYATVRLSWPTIAGKTGTAEVGEGLADHAWFAGYTPAEDPRWAIVVVLEHGGNGATAAGPLARRVVQALQQAGY